ncbi:MAG: glycosyltransferase family 2 protein [Nitrospira sp.]|nr:glycosyltransferase family 2 protein [Nitrospira sp.]
MEADASMELSIIIVNWNSKDYLQKCIASIMDSKGETEFEIVVIDGGSFDGSGEMLKECYPQVKFLQSEKNIGFAKANNIAFKASSGRHILFLNPDTEVVIPAINVLFDQMQKLPRAGAIGCKLLNADGSVQTSCTQSFPTILNQLLNSEFLQALFPKSRLWGMTSLFSTTDEPAEVEVLSGACIMMRRSLFEQIGQFSEDYFMYAEDIDLCYKVRQAGYENYYIPNATVFHFGGGSTQQRPSDFAVVMMRASVWRFLRKTRGKMYGSGYRCSMLISGIGRIVCLLVLFPLYLIRGCLASWKASARKWWAISVWSIGLKEAGGKS